MNAFQKFIISFISTFFFLISFNSCEKCARCTYVYEKHDTDPTKDKLYTQEECGNDKDIKHFQESMQYAAEEFSDTALCTTW